MTITEKLKQLYKESFGKDSQAYTDYFFSVIKNKNRVFLREDNKIISAAYINPKPAMIFGKKQKIAYISAASTLTEFRGQQKIAIIMRQTLNKLYNRGYIFAALNPFDCSYYKQYGFTDVCYCKTKLLCGNNVLHSREASKKDAEIMSFLDNYMCNDFDNYLVSSKKRICAQFDEFGVDGVKAYILSSDGMPMAYYFDEGSDINCYACSNMSEFLNCKNISGKKISDFYCKDEPFVQARIVNAIKCLKNLDFSKSSDMIKTIQITDNIIEGNSIIVKISVNNGKATITKAYSADNCVDIAVLTDKIFSYSRNFFADRY